MGKSKPVKRQKSLKSSLNSFLTAHKKASSGASKPYSASQSDNKKKGDDSPQTFVSLHIWNGGKRKDENGRPLRTLTTFIIGKPILLIGEGNFSFSVALVKKFQGLGADSTDCNAIYASCYDDEKTLFEKYPDARGNIEFLRENNVRVMFGVDATRLHKMKVFKRKTFHRIIFHFPHVGLGIQDKEVNIRENQKMLRAFLASAKTLMQSGPVEYRSSMIPEKVVSASVGSIQFAIKEKVSKFDAKNDQEINSYDSEEEESESDNDDSDSEAEKNTKPTKKSKKKSSKADQKAKPVHVHVHEEDSLNSEIHITIKHIDPYTLWDVKKLSEGNLFCRESFRFDAACYEGYEHRRTIGFEEGISLTNNEELAGKNCKTFVFALKK